MNAVITRNGRAINIRLTKHLGHGLDRKTIGTVKSWLFQPALGPDGKRTAVLQTIKVTFPAKPLVAGDKSALARRQQRLLALSFLAVFSAKY
jgi:hypothetical protein